MRDSEQQSVAGTLVRCLHPFFGETPHARGGIIRLAWRSIQTARRERKRVEKKDGYLKMGCWNSAALPVASLHLRGLGEGWGSWWAVCACLCICGGGKQHSVSSPDHWRFTSTEKPPHKWSVCIFNSAAASMAQSNCHGLSKADWLSNTSVSVGEG